MGRMKELLDQRLEENKWEMWELLKEYCREGGSYKLLVRVTGLLVKIRFPEEDSLC